MNIVLMGPKGAGKSAVGAALAELTYLPVLELDTVIEELDGNGRSCREIYRDEGEAAFRALERNAARQASTYDWHIIITGGGAMMDGETRRLLRRDAVLVMLTADEPTLWQRATKRGMPPWLEGPDGRERFKEQTRHRLDVLKPYADIVLDCTVGAIGQLAEQAQEALREEMAVRCTSANTYGDVIRATTFGESHGKAIGVVLDGLHPGIPVDEEAIQKEMDRRRPGQSRIVTQRKEGDIVHILSGVFEGKTTGAPIAMVIYNEDQKSKHYDNIKDIFRPGHADFTFYRKYGIRDHRGGGRSSGRETATRVACGALARQVLAERGVRIVAHTVEVAGIAAKTCDYEVIEQNPVRCADLDAAAQMEQAVIDARKAKDSVGGIIQLDIHGLPAGLGDPVFCKLDARLTHAIMTIGAIKGVEVGGGFHLARLRGSESNDPISGRGFLSNNAGGILGGISTGDTITLRLSVKPTSSISQPQHTIDTEGNEREIEVVGRHDPCIVPRAVPVVEHMAALSLLDAWEIQARLRPGWDAAEANKT